MFQIQTTSPVFLNAVEHRVLWLAPDHEDNPKPEGQWHNTGEQMFTDEGLLVVRLFLSAHVPGEREPVSIRIDWDLTQEQFDSLLPLQGQPVGLEGFRVSVRKSGIAIFSADAVTPVGDAK